MKFFVATPTGKTTTITIEPSFTIKDVKNKIEGHEGIPSDLQHLNFAGRQLKDAQTLLECNIRDESTIKLTYPMSQTFEFTVRTMSGKPVVFTINPEFLVLFMKLRIFEQTFFRFFFSWRFPGKYE